MTDDAVVVPGVYVRNRYDSCVFCWRPGYVEADHVRPVTAGGRSVPANLAPLCPACNLVKSDFWRDPGVPADVTYHPFSGLDDVQLARDIRRAEVEWLAERFDWADIEAAVWHG